MYGVYQFHCLKQVEKRVHGPAQTHAQHRPGQRSHSTTPTKQAATASGLFITQQECSDADFLVTLQVATGSTTEIYVVLAVL